jgi:biotin operon repressor
VDEILLNGEERDRLQVLQAAKKGQIRQSQAAAELRLSGRWVKKLIQRLRKQGNRGVLHGLKGRRSNRCIAREKEHEAVQLIREHYRDYGPTQAAEMLEQHHGIAVSRETVRSWMCKAKLWRAKRATMHKVHGWRPRRERQGELVQWDTSEHDWLEGRGPKLYLIAMIDDATMRTSRCGKIRTQPPFSATWKNAQ